MNNRPIRLEIPISTVHLYATLSWPIFEGLFIFIMRNVLIRTTTSEQINRLPYAFSLYSLKCTYLTH